MLQLLKFVKAHCPIPTALAYDGSTTNTVNPFTHLDVMDALAYTHSYAAHEAHHGIEYEFAQLNLLNGSHYKNMSQALLLGALSAGLMLTVLSTTAETAMARNLRQGMRGDDVAQVQTLLRNQGFSIRYGADGSGRGKFGPQTDKAVRGFQSKAKLAVDGVVGPNTMGALQGKSTNTSSTSSNGVGGSTPQGSLRLNSSGPAVAELQTLLRNRGYSIRYGANGSGRGKFGQQTLTAVRSFQQNAGLAVDGVAGPRTMAALRNGGTAPAAAAPVATGGSTVGRYTIATNSSKGLNVRTGPGTQYGIATSLPNGTPVNVAAMSNGWAQIAPGRYVSARFLRK
ncbi:MAG: peptidoglycan-binding protein [Spirulinaceae cyanobacterium]